MLGEIIRKGVAVFVLVVAVGGLSYYYNVTRPCAQPIEYSLGIFDSRFGISREDLIVNLKKATALWSKEAGRELFTYVESGGIPVRLVYDTRQQNAELGEEIEDAQAIHTARRAEIERMEAAYKQQKAAYESQVQYWNARGGAPTKEFQKLEAERLALVETLNVLNDAIARLNAETRATNAEVATYNQGAGKDYEAGVFYSGYGKSYIELYEFTSSTQLIRLAAHEFGHALGLDHNADQNSIMFEKNLSDRLVLSAADKASLQELCGFE